MLKEAEISSVSDNYQETKKSEIGINTKSKSDKESKKTKKDNNINKEKEKIVEHIKDSDKEKPGMRKLRKRKINL